MVLHPIVTYTWALEDEICIRIFCQQTTINFGQLEQNKGIYWKDMGQLTEQR